MYDHVGWCAPVKLNRAREPGVNPGLTRSGKGDGRSITPLGCPGKALRPDRSRVRRPAGPCGSRRSVVGEPRARAPRPGKDLVTSTHVPRTRGDRCPGVFRPWLADDGLLIRLRLVGGHLTGAQLRALFDIAERFADGDVHVTTRANLQVRGFTTTGALSDEAIAAIEAAGLVPSRGHELIRNILVSPQTGFSGGRADLRPVATELDSRLLADDRVRRLPGRFLFVLDDGRGDLVDRPCDLGLVALDATRAQLRVGDRWGRVVKLADAPGHLVALAHEFLHRRGGGPTAPWHVRELREPLSPIVTRAREVPAPTEPLPFGPVGGGRHHEAPEGVLTRLSAAALLGRPTLVVTPWRGVFVPESTEQQ